MCFFFTFSLESASHTCVRNIVMVDYNVVVFCIHSGLLFALQTPRLSSQAQVDSLGMASLVFSVYL